MSRAENYSLGVYLVELRKKADMTQGELAEKLGFGSPQFISNWERGASAPSLSAQSKIIKLLGANAEKLIELNLRHTRKLVLKVFDQVRKGEGVQDGVNPSQNSLLHLRKRVPSLEISESEKLILTFALGYLHLENLREDKARDFRALQQACKAIRPILKKGGMLNEFRRLQKSV